MKPFRKQIRASNGVAMFAYGFNTNAPIYTVETHVPGGHGRILHSFSGLEILGYPGYTSPPSEVIMKPFRKQIRSSNGYAVFAYGYNTNAPVYTVETHVPGGHGRILHSFSGPYGRENAYKRFREYSLSYEEWNALYSTNS